MVSYDRLYVGILASVVAACFVNLRIFIARPKLIRTRAGVAHLLSNIFAVIASLNIWINESILSSECILEHGLGCGMVHSAKLLNYLILFWRCNIVTNHHPLVRYGFYFLVALKIAAVSSHCAMMQPIYNSTIHVCLDRFEPISTLSTFVLDIITDFSLTALFMLKIYIHLRKHDRHISSSTQKIRRLFREYIYEAVPVLCLSIALNGLVVSNVFVEYTVILIYADLILQLRLTSDLLVLNRLTDETAIYASRTITSSLERSSKYDQETPF
ncbi:uncharacterized protein VTP21DRAFT_8847 [Calcarisporiella thermophila]|uniref:uncharacterized protein n=1 Tax=Calcarisporiella thermophila TaxID=911321 RepID=UPI003742CF0B